MRAELQAVADIRGQAINLTFTWTDADVRPRFRLLRRQRAYPQRATDGCCVVDLAELLQANGAPWPQIQRRLFLATNNSTADGLPQVEFTICLDQQSQPQCVQIVYYDLATLEPMQHTIQDVTRIDWIARVDEPPWAQVQCATIFVRASAQTEQVAGQFAIYRGHAAGLPNQCVWSIGDQTPTSVVFARIELVETRLTEIFDRDRAVWQGQAMISNNGLAPEVNYYYAAFIQAGAADSYSSDPAWRATASASAHYGLGEELYQRLPAIHRNYDQQGQLHRLLQVFGAALDQLRSQTETLRSRHDVLTARADLLPHLAHLIGWELDQTRDEVAQRNAIRFAPERYATIGTISNLKAVVNEITGGECQVKEYVHNIFLSNAVEPIRLWEIWKANVVGWNDETQLPQWSEPEPVTRTDALDGRPAALLEQGDDVRLIWHANRSDRFQLWQKVGTAVGIAPQPLFPAAHDTKAVDCNDTYVAAVKNGSGLWLFWDSDRTGHRQLWHCPPGSVPCQLIEHAAEERHPTAVCDAQGRIWLFWASNRRGPTDIWMQCYSADQNKWTAPLRVTTAHTWHYLPAATIDAKDRLWLFWCGEAGDMGAASSLYGQCFELGAAGVLEPLDAQPCNLSVAEATTAGDSRWRDAAPAAVWWQDKLWLFWHSDRAGQWQIWGRVYAEATGWGAPFPVTDESSADKEPAVLTDGETLRLFWCSQRRGHAYQSRTIDTGDAALLANLETCQDRAHYTVDTGCTDADRYARGAIGIFLDPANVDATLWAGQSQQISDALHSFLPVQVRALVTVEPERVYPPGLPQDRYADHLNVELSERIEGFTDSYSDTIHS